MTVLDAKRPALADPHASAWSQEAERAVLAVVLDGRYGGAWGRVREAGATPATFWIRDHRLVALVIDRLWSERARIDAQTVAEACRVTPFADAMEALRALDGGAKPRLSANEVAAAAGSLLDALGGYNAIADLAAGYAPATGLERNAAALVAYHRQRQVIAELAELTRLATAPNGSGRVPEIADRAASRLGEIAGAGVVAQTLVDGVDRVLADHDAAKARGGEGKTTGSWGLPALDQRIPITAGQMTTVAGDTGGGKTSLAFAAVMATARKLGPGSVAVVNMEQTVDELALILVAREIGVHVSTLECGWLTAEQHEAANAVRAEIDRLGIFVRDNSGRTTIADIVGWVEQRRRRSGNLHLVIVDHIGLIDAADPRAKEYEVLTQASKALKRLAMTGIAVVVIAQLNSEGQKRVANAEPKLTDLHGSGSMRKDSDNVLFLWRRTLEKTPARDVDLVIAKARLRGEATVHATFHAGDGQRFTMRTIAAQVDDIAARRQVNREAAAERAAKTANGPSDNEDLFNAR